MQQKEWIEGDKVKWRGCTKKIFCGCQGGQGYPVHPGIKL